MEVSTLATLKNLNVLDRGYRTRGYISEGVALVHAGSDQGIELQLGVLTRCADPGVPEMPYSSKF